MGKKKRLLPPGSPEREIAGSRVALLRDALGFTQVTLAKAAKTGKKQVGEIESGQGNPDSITWGRVARALYVELDEIDPENIENWPTKSNNKLIEMAKRERAKAEGEKTHAIDPRSIQELTDPLPEAKAADPGTLSESRSSTGAAIEAVT